MGFLYNYLIIKNAKQQNCKPWLLKTDFFALLEKLEERVPNKIISVLIFVRITSRFERPGRVITQLVSCSALQFPTSTKNQTLLDNFFPYELSICRVSRKVILKYKHLVTYKVACKT